MDENNVFLKIDDYVIIKETDKKLVINDLKNNVVRHLIKIEK